jgi:hypothetical protein
MEQPFGRSKPHFELGMDARGCLLTVPSDGAAIEDTDTRARRQLGLPGSSVLANASYLCLFGTRRHATRLREGKRR